MKRIAQLIAVLAASAALISCASSGNTSTAPTPVSIAGSWEFVASSNTSANTITGVEVALAEGVVQVNGINQPDGNISASGPNQIMFVDLSTAPNIGFSQNCPGTGVSALTGTVANLGGPVNFTFSEGGNVFVVNATLSTDGSTITGTYTPQTGNPCNDSGTILGTKVPKLSGQFNGQLILPDGTNPMVDGTASESSSGIVTLTLINTANNASFSLTGPAMGNAFSLQGTYQGDGSSYFSYFQVVKVPTLYMANSANPAAPVFAGSLAQPPLIP